MSSGHLAHRAGSPSERPFRGRDRRAVFSYEYELAKHRRTEAQLREALAREQALLLQKQKLMQKQMVLANLFGGPENVAQRVESLSPREYQIMELILAGHPNKNIAADLGINQRTVENHRAGIMRKTASKSFSALVRFALAASLLGEGGALELDGRGHEY